MAKEATAVNENKPSDNSWNERVYEVGLNIYELRWMRDGLRLLIHRTNKKHPHMTYMHELFQQLELAINVHEGKK